jgi:predicted esterase
VHLIAARTHGRYLVEPPGSDRPAPLLVGFHGYAERADDMLDALRRIRGERHWLLVSIQALNRFYTKAQTVVANWMTREDRDRAIDDNIDYVAAVVAEVGRQHAVTGTVVYVGFSQGVAMAYRAVAVAHERSREVPLAAGAIVLAGDVPPDVVPRLATCPPLLIGRGTEDTWYTEAKAAADLAHLRAAGAVAEVCVFDGGHVWDATFIAAAGAFLDRMQT